VKRECDRDGFRRGIGLFAGFRVVLVLEVKSVFKRRVADGACPCEWRVLLSVIE
jgi:hypothetical protein